MVENRLPMPTILSFPQEIRLMRMAACPHAAQTLEVLRHEVGREDRAAAVPLQKLDELRQAALIVRAKVVVDMPAQVIFPEVVIVLGACADDGIECVQTKVARLAEQPSQFGILHATAQRPDGINEGQPGQLEPGGAQIPNL